MSSRVILKNGLNGFRKKSEGSVYRSKTKPPRKPLLLDESTSVQGLLKKGFRPIDSYPQIHKYIQPDVVQPPVARLSHGLEKVLFSSGVHRIINPSTGKYNFPRYLQKLHHPDLIDYDKMPPFRTPSVDDKLHEIAVQHNARYKGSTSSISSSLAQLYFLLSRFRNVDVGNLSRFFQQQTTKFTPSQKLPSSFVLYPRDGVYSIDRFQPIVNTTMLSSLGKSVEKMITMEKDQFEQTFLKTSTSNMTCADEVEAFNYLHTNKFVLRSQLDCIHSDIGIFDLKTRATFPIRIFSEEDRELHLEYKLDRLRGMTNSFEKEYYDMARSSFLRNSFQTRIGNMAGIFVVYHNTDEVFGFEFLKREELEQAIYQSQKMADYVYYTTLNMFDQLLDTITSYYDPSKALNVTLHTTQMGVNDALMTVYVQEAKFNEYNKLIIPSQNEPIESLKVFRVYAHTSVDQGIVLGPLHINDWDNPTAYLKITQVTSSKNTQESMYHNMVDEWIGFNDKSKNRKPY